MPAVYRADRLLCSDSNHSRIACYNLPAFGNHFNNRPPTVNGQSIPCADVTSGTPAVSETGSVTVGDLDNDPLTLSVVSSTNQDGGAAYGSLSFTNNPVTVTNGTGTGTFSYTVTALPAGAPTGKHLVDTFAYKANDGTADSTSTANIVVTLDRAPTAGSASIGTILPGASVTTASLGGDPDADFVTLSSTLDPAIGTLVLNPDGTLTFTAAAGDHGPYTINYTVTDTKTSTGGVNDNGCLSSSGQLNVTVNTPPVASGFDVGCVVDTLTAANIDVLAHASDADGDPLTVAITSATNGTATVNADNTVTFVAAGYGAAGFSYTVSDGIATSSPPAAVTIHFDRSPTAVASTGLGTLLPGQSVTTGVLYGDPDGLNTLTVAVTGVTGGTVKDNGDGTFTFTASSPLSSHAAGFSFTATDECGIAAGGVVGGTVNTPPVAAGHDYGCVISTASKPPAQTVNIAGAGGLASDADGDPLTIQIVSAANGTATANADGTVTFTPSGYGDANFVYTVSDGYATSGQATVSYHFDRPPVAPNINLSVAMNSTTGVSGVLARTDPDGDPLTITHTSLIPASSGTLTFTDPTHFTFVPASNFSGTATFTYTAADDCTSTTGTVTITVNSNARTQGYWKNHETSTSTGGYWTMDNGTQITSLTIGGATYKPDEVVAIMNMSTGTGTSANAILILFDQLVAAKLNVLNNVATSQADKDAITQGDNLIIQAAGSYGSKLTGTKKGSLLWGDLIHQAYVPVSDPTLGQLMVNDASILNAFNNSGK